jgi:hypothetical protein
MANSAAAKKWFKETEKSIKEARAGTNTRYLLHIPRKLTPGRVLMHNHVQHTIDMPLGLNGFRAWTALAAPASFERCRCKWSGLPHWHLKGTRHTCVKKLFNAEEWTAADA